MVLINNQKIYLCYQKCISSKQVVKKILLFAVQKQLLMIFLSKQKSEDVQIAFTSHKILLLALVHLSHLSETFEY